VNVSANLEDSNRKRLLQNIQNEQASQMAQKQQHQHTRQSYSKIEKDALDLILNEQDSLAHSKRAQQKLQNVEVLNYNKCKLDDKSRLINLNKSNEFDRNLDAWVDRGVKLRIQRDEDMYSEREYKRKSNNLDTLSYNKGLMHSAEKRKKLQT